jgi:KUP system potassium uptake protein
MSSNGSSSGRLAGLTLGALGVVYGDIGTSPLYALAECFDDKHGLAVTQANVFGILSLIIWSLLLIVTVKYLVFVLRADNQGEGGILALMSLAFPQRRNPDQQAPLTKFMVVLGLFGSALLYGDGMITPAVTVMGAMDGLKIASPMMAKFVVPLSVIILVALFSVQKAGTARVGRVFGPVMIVWFVVLLLMGIRGIVRDPGVLVSFSPHHGLAFLLANKFLGFVVLGSVFLVVTGGEALYADMGHFGRRPIRIAWFALVLPALVVNYLGQGALLLTSPGRIENPFYQLAPQWALYPLLVLATAAAVIASQALISGAFSLTMQAIQLGYVPRMAIEHTSEQERGQIYMPHVNVLLACACIGLVIGFQSASNIAAAYGIAVTLTMLVTTVLFYFAAQRAWGWSAWQAALIVVPALGIELAFFGANVLKIAHGGWFPLLVGAVLFTLMTTWKRGRWLVWQRMRGAALPVDTFIESISRRGANRVEGTAVYMAGNSDGTPLALLHNLKHNKVLHQRIVFLTILVSDEPRVPDDRQVEVEELPQGFWRVRAHFGFFEEPDVPTVLRRCGDRGLLFTEHDTTFFLSRETIIPGVRQRGMATWRDRLFAIMARNAATPTAYFRLPANRVVELGMQVEI